MTEARFALEATPGNFSKLVLENSAKGPVLVNYWSPRAGPCMLLMPRLVKLTAENADKFLLVTVNTDLYAPLAHEYGVNSVPAIKVFRTGKVVASVYGAQPENEIKSLIERHVRPELSNAHVAAIRQYQAGNVDYALTLLAQAAMDDPSDLRIPGDLIKIMIFEQRLLQAQELIDALPASAKADSSIAILRAHLDFLRTATDAPPRDQLEQDVSGHPEDLEARFQLSAVKVMQDDYAGAMEQLIEIMRRDRSFRNDAARLGLLAIFRLLGDKGELVERYRRLALEIPGG